MLETKRRQRPKEMDSVIFLQKPFVENCDDTPVRFGPDQPSRCLNKTQAGFRKRDFPKRIPSSGADPFGKRLFDRFCRYRKRDFGDHNMRAKISLQVQSFGERRQSKKDGPFSGADTLFMKGKNVFSGSFSLDKDSVLPLRGKSLSDGFHLAT